MVCAYDCIIPGDQKVCLVYGVQSILINELPQQVDLLRALVKVDEARAQLSKQAARSEEIIMPSGKAVEQEPPTSEDLPPPVFSFTES